MLESIREEARQQVARLSKHPCIVLWCGNNEVKNGWEDWGWQGQFNWTPEQRARLEKAMDTIFGYPSTTSNTSSTLRPAAAPLHHHLAALRLGPPRVRHPRRQPLLGRLVG